MNKPSNFLLTLIVLFSCLVSFQSYAIDTSKDYVLAAGDTIKISVFQNPELLTEARVSETGNITFPLIGQVSVSGKTLRQAEELVEQGLVNGGFVQKPQVNIVILQILGNRVAVLGMVNRPGRYPIDVVNTRLSEMIATAGGVAMAAGNGFVQLSGVRDGLQVNLEIDLAKVIAGSLDKDIDVKPGDVIYVSPGNQVSILGAVNRPGRYPLEKIEMNLEDVIAMAGGIAVAGSDTVIVKGTRDGLPIRTEVDLAAGFLNKNDNTTIRIQSGDQIYVHRAPAFYIYGEAQRPGSYRVERNMTVAQALATGGGPTLRGTQRNIKIFRTNSSGQIEKIQPKLTEKVNQDDVIYVEESLF